MTVPTKIKPHQVSALYPILKENDRGTISCPYTLWGGVTLGERKKRYFEPVPLYSVSTVCKLYTRVYCINDVYVRIFKMYLFQDFHNIGSWSV